MPATLGLHLVAQLHLGFHHLLVGHGKGAVFKHVAQRADHDIGIDVDAAALDAFANLHAYGVAHLIDVTLQRHSAFLLVGRGRRSGVGRLCGGTVLGHRAKAAQRRQQHYKQG